MLANDFLEDNGAIIGRIEGKCVSLQTFTSKVEANKKSYEENIIGAVDALLRIDEC